jgi:hypothetical protein
MLTAAAHHTIAAAAQLSTLPVPHDDPGSLPLALRQFLLCVFFLAFVACFIAAWWACATYRYPRFGSMSLAQKADTCSRIVSTLHTAIIVSLLFYGIATTTWDEHMSPTTSVALLQQTLCVTVGYFISDTVVIIMYKVPQWQVFVLHHCMAATPFLIYLLVPSCPRGVFVLAGFLLVEVTNFSLNAQTFLEQHGLGGSKYYAAALYTTLTNWVIFRLVLPVYLIVVIHMYIAPSTECKACLVPGYICGYFIVLFCFFVFFFILVKEVRLRWTSAPDIADVAELEDDVRVLRVHPGLPMTDDELQITRTHPERILLYEARERMHEVEMVVERAVEQRFRRQSDGEVQPLKHAHSVV